jgi:hypothetical protein
LYYNIFVLFLLLYPSKKEGIEKMKRGFTKDVTRSQLAQLAGFEPELPMGLRQL